MFLGIVSVSAVCLVLAYSGWQPPDDPPNTTTDIRENLHDAELERLANWVNDIGPWSLSYNDSAHTFDWTWLKPADFPKRRSSVFLHNENLEYGLLLCPTPQPLPTVPYVNSADSKSHVPTEHPTDWTVAIDSLNHADGNQSREEHCVLGPDQHPSHFEMDRTTGLILAVLKLLVYAELFRRLPKITGQAVSLIIQDAKRIYNFGQKQGSVRRTWTRPRGARTRVCRIRGTTSIRRSQIPRGEAGEWTRSNTPSEIPLPTLSHSPAADPDRPRGLPSGLGRAWRRHQARFPGVPQGTRLPAYLPNDRLPDRLHTASSGRPPSLCTDRDKSLGYRLVEMSRGIVYTSSPTAFYEKLALFAVGYIINEYPDVDDTMDDFFESDTDYGSRSDWGSRDGRMWEDFYTDWEDETGQR